MLNIGINFTKIKLTLPGDLVQAYCQHVFIAYSRNFIAYDRNLTMTQPLTTEWLAAVWFYNKLRTKSFQRPTRMVIPLEYAALIRRHCAKAPCYHELHQVANYEIQVQIEKQLPPQLLNQ